MKKQIGTGGTGVLPPNHTTFGGVWPSAHFERNEDGILSYHPGYALEICKCGEKILHSVAEVHRKVCSNIKCKLNIDRLGDNDYS